MASRWTDVQHEEEAMSASSPFVPEAPGMDAGEFEGGADTTYTSETGLDSITEWRSPFARESRIDDTATNEESVEQYEWRDNEESSPDASEFESAWDAPAGEFEGNAVADQSEQFCHECGHALASSAAAGEHPFAMEQEGSLDAEDAWEAHERYAAATTIESNETYESLFGLEQEEEAFEGEDAPTVASFTASLGAEWSRRRGGAPSAAAITDWLAKDHAETIVGARQRFGKRFGSGRFTEDAITKAWMISRRDQMDFQLARGIAALGSFAPPKDAVTLVSSPIIDGSNVAPVAPIMVRFTEELRRRYGRQMTASNYRGHGGGSFNNRGHSLDLYISGSDDRGFFPRNDAIAFLRAVHAAARAVGAQWRVIYNDFAVADAINREFGRQHVIFVGTVRRDQAKRVTGLNWHGPAPLIVHFHLDLAPGTGSGGAISGGISGAISGGTGHTTSDTLGGAILGGIGAAIRGGMSGAVSGTPKIAINESTVAAVLPYRDLAHAAAARYGVDAALILGVIAAESGGKRDLVAKSGYTGVMQAGKGEAHKNPAHSIDLGTRKLRDFRKIMEGILAARNQKYDALPEAEQLRLLALAYNAGPVTVAKALQYAAEAGHPTAWLDAEHYRRALLFTGAYSLHQAAASCMPKLSDGDRAARIREASVTWNKYRLGTKKVNWRKLPDPPAWSAIAAQLPALVTCAIEFKHRNSPRYAAKIMAYRDRVRR